MKETYYFPIQDDLSRIERKYVDFTQSFSMTNILKNNNDPFTRSLRNIFIAQGLHDGNYEPVTIDAPDIYKNFIGRLHTRFDFNMEILSTIIAYYTFPEIMDFIVPNTMNDPRFLFTQFLSEYPHWLYMFSFENKSNSYIIFKRYIRYLIEDKKKLNLSGDTKNLINYFTCFLKRTLLDNQYNVESGNDSYIYENTILTASLITHLCLVYIKLDSNNNHILYPCIRTMVEILTS